ncbi:anti-sigma factor family protein [Streptantibioticus rubrisoli]|uniref:Zf-HC2 domain-containing protein n=1 Tax=Streptantibioticus rubrisoli TaxID=1387313 RepID=A0ABT1PEJ1_9ACTN|nr:zf-HC2 domain-containing protein [Streptantibioticus rubrisoli]MCQ4043794.1 zf-HC2 domain-containing protein [Streptantibioticus rubrisoli]
MNADHEAIRLSLGGYVLGTLSPAESDRVCGHLEECAECRAEHARLAGLPALLATITEAEAAGRAAPAAGEDWADRLLRRAAHRVQPSPHIAAPPAEPSMPKVPEPSRLEQLLQQTAARRRTTRRRQLVSVAAALTLMAAAASGGTLLATLGSAGSEVAQSGTTSPAPARTLSASDPTTGVSASVKVSPAVWGSTVQVSAEGVPPGITCRLQAVGVTGATATAATWQAGTYSGSATISGTVPMAPGSIGHFDMYATNGQKLLTIPA